MRADVLGRDFKLGSLLREFFPVIFPENATADPCLARADTS